MKECIIKVATQIITIAIGTGLGIYFSLVIIFG